MEINIFGMVSRPGAGKTIGLFLAVAIAATLLKDLTRPRGPIRRNRDRQGNAGRRRHDPEQQMRAIEGIAFAPRPLLNREEARLLPVLDSVAARFGNSVRVMAQVSMGEVLSPSGRGQRGRLDARTASEAHAAINSKRLDFALFDADHRMLFAVECQGSGRYSNSASMRDAVKREALRLAGIPLLEVAKGDRPAEVESRALRLTAERLAALGSRPDRRIRQSHAAPIGGESAPAHRRLRPWAGRRFRSSPYRRSHAASGQ